MIFFSSFFNQINASLQTYIDSTVSNVMSATQPVATTLVAIYVGFWGWSMMRGLIQEPVMDGTARILRVCIITTLAINTGNYHSYISDWLWQSPDALGKLVLSGSGGGSNTINVLDDLMAKYFTAANTLFVQGATNGVLNVGAAISDFVLGVAIALAGILFTAYTAYLLLFSKIALAVLLAIGPIFILLTIFDATRKFFDAWIGQVINFVFLTMITMAISSLVISILSNAIVISDATTATTLNIVSEIAVSVLSFLVLLQVPSIAAVLGGGVAISTLESGNAIRKYLFGKKDKKPKPPEDKGGGGSISKK